MSGSEIWGQFVEFLQALPPWLSALPVWLTSLLTLAVGFWIGRVVRTRSTKLQEQKAARETLLLAVEAMKIDPGFRTVPGLGKAVLDQLKRQKRLKIPPELEQRLKGADNAAVKPKRSAEKATASKHRQGEAAAPQPTAEPQDNPPARAADATSQSKPDGSGAGHERDLGTERSDEDEKTAPPGSPLVRRDDS